MKYLLLILFAAQISNAQQPKLYKTLDGSTVYCHSELASDIEKNQKAVKIETIELRKSSAQNVQINLRISLVKCVDQTWRFDSNPSSENYIYQESSSAEKIRVNQNFSNFEVIVLNNKSDIVYTQMLSDLSTSSTQDISFELNESSEKTYEVFLRTTVSGSTSNGTIIEPHNEAFGSYNLIIK